MTPEIRTMKLAELKPASYNPRKISKQALKGLTASVKRFGLVQPVVVNKRAGYVVVGGHQRVEALKAAGETMASVVLVDLDEKEEKALNIALNSPAISGQFTDELQAMLRNLREGLPHEFIDLRFDELMADLRTAAAPEDDIPEPPKTPVTKPGNIWKLGNHHLICADSTLPKTREVVKSIGLASLLFTSPPYWVGKSYEYQKSENEIDVFVKAIAATMAAVTKKDESRIIINTGTGNGRLFSKRVETLLLMDKWVAALRPQEWLMRHLRIWVKQGSLPAAIPPKTDFIAQSCEFIGTFYQAEGKQRGMNRLPDKWTQQGYFDDVRGDARGAEHCASFPVELPHRFIRLYSKPGEVVTDVFGGAGTTLIACQQTDRRAILVERDPAYCDVTISGWEKFTGGNASLLSKK